MRKERAANGALRGSGSDRQKATLRQPEHCAATHARYAVVRRRPSRVLPKAWLRCKRCSCLPPRRSRPKPGRPRLGCPQIYSCPPWFQVLVEWPRVPHRPTRNAPMITRANHVLGDFRGRLCTLLRCRTDCCYELRARSASPPLFCHCSILQSRPNRK